MAEHKQILKVVILGDSEVGKTSLLNQYITHEFTQSYKATIGADFMTKEVSVGKSTVALQMWDTAGQEVFNSLGHAFYRGADVVVIVYDMTNHKSFEDIDKWKDEFFLRGNPRDPDTFPFVLLANKSDRSAERQVTVEEAQAWCKANNDAPFYEVSAKENINVEEAFNIIAEKATANQKTAQLDQPAPINVRSNGNIKQYSENKSCNC